MRAFFSHKVWIVLLSVLALAALTELAIGMESVSFRASQEFGQGETQRINLSVAEVLDSVFSVPLKTQIAVWVLFVLLFVLIGLLLSPEMRKKLILIAIRVAVTYWALWLLFTRYRGVLIQMGLNLSALGNAPASANGGDPAPAFVPPQTNSWLSYVLGIALAAALVFVAWKAYGIWRELNPPPSAMNQLAKIARTSLHELSSGRDSTDVILNCYFRMSDAVAEKKNLERKASMTPGEFAVRLERAGLPGDSVKRLTRLFESVRYGGRKSDPASVNEAVACLTAILQHCEEPV